MLQLIREILRLLTPVQRRRLVLQQGVSVAMAIGSVVGISSVMPLFAVLAEPSQIQTNPWLRFCWQLSGEPSTEVFLVLLGGVVVVATSAASLINFIGTTASTRFAYWVGAELQTLLFAEYLSRDYLFHVRSNSMALVNNTIQQVNRVVQGILLPFVSLLSAVISAVVILAAVVAVSPVLAGATGAILGAGFLLTYLLSRGRLRQLGEVTQDQQRRQLRQLAEGLGSFREMRIFGVEGNFLRRFSKTAQKIGRSVCDAQVLSIAPKHLLESVAIVGLVVGSLVVTWGRAEPGEALSKLGFLAVAAMRVLPSLQLIHRSLAQIKNSQPSFERVAKDLESARQSGHGSVAGGGIDAGDSRPERDIEFRDVRFRYSPNGPAVLDGLSLRIPAGSTVALVGASGSGKTTAIDVLLGLLVPASGELRVDGEPIGTSDLRAWQACLTFVPQQIFLLDATVAENVAFGEPVEKIDRAKVEECMRLARLGELLLAPRGMDAPVGERGARLSGGQRQRLGIARALYRRSNVIVLDEATSALDGITEGEFMSSLSAVRGRRTVVMVAHRLSTVRQCDVIFELEAGRVARCGTFDELMMTSERFRRMAGASGDSVIVGA